MRTAPEFGPEVTDEAMEQMLYFVLHYEAELKTHPRSGHGKAQLALVRRMLGDLGVPSYLIYDEPTGAGHD